MNRSSEPPDEPLQRSEVKLLSPTSPKPVHPPQPTNIPVLEMQMDVGFNQTELHMNDPAMHDTDIRPDAWRDPTEQDVKPVDESTSSIDVASAQNDTTATSLPAQTVVNDNDELATTNESTEVASAAIDGTSTHFLNAPPIETTEPSSLPSSDPTLLTSEAPETLPASIPAQSLQSSPLEQIAHSSSLLDELQNSLMHATNADPVTSPSSSLPPNPAQNTLDSAAIPAAGLGAPSNGLPPRPPPQEQPLIHPNYLHSQHIRDYHPHAANPAFHPQQGRNNSVGNAADPKSNNFVPPPAPSGGQYGAEKSQSPSTAMANASLSSHRASANSSVAPLVSRREAKLAAGEPISPDDEPWGPEIQRKYENFMEEERKYVNEAKWDQFPQGSRLFVGNLSSEKVTKRDIYHVFHNYGELAQISIKQAYGFVQFVRAEDCQRAMDNEQGRQIKDKRIHLEISKPQKPRRDNGASNRRSRSPEFSNHGRSGSNVDRYIGGGRSSHGRGSRDDYRDYRSPSPRRYRDRYDDRRRSRSPPSNYNNQYSRSSARRDSDEELPLPRRHPQDVPEIQILIIGQLDSQFVQWVERSFRDRGIRVDAFIVSPRLNEDAIVRRQIMEGVLAVSKLKRHNQDSARVSLTIFKRQPGNKDVQYEEYDQLEPNTAAELVLRERNLQRAAPAYPSYGQPAAAPAPTQQYAYSTQSQQPSYPTQPNHPYAPQQNAPFQRPIPPPAAINPVDPNLQNILNTLNQANPAVTQQYPPTQYSAPIQQSPRQQQPAGSTAQNPFVEDILARLGSYNGGPR